MWESIQSVVVSLGLPEVVILLVILGAGIAYVARTKGGARTNDSHER
jgi:hypothetical protein